jgi:hypothetical protein
MVGFHRALDVFLHQVRVDGNRCRRSGAGRGDDLRTRVRHIAGSPDTDGTGAAGRVDRDEAGSVDLAPEGR